MNPIFKLTLLGAAISLTACGTLDADKVDYRSATSVKAPSLEMVRWSNVNAEQADSMRWRPRSSDLRRLPRRSHGGYPAVPHARVAHC